jgi:hypothetical protein
VGAQQQEDEVRKAEKRTYPQPIRFAWKRRDGVVGGHESSFRHQPTKTFRNSLADARPSQVQSANSGNGRSSDLRNKRFPSLLDVNGHVNGFPEE